MKKVIMSESLQNVLDTVSESNRALISEMFVFYQKQYEQLKTENPNNGKDIAYSIQQKIQENIDKKIADCTEHKVSCAKGCSFCCYLSVDITLDEAHLLLEYSEHNNIEIDWNRVGRQARKANSFDTLRYQQRKCVFLDDDGACKAYEYRPNSCRKLIAVTDAKLCDTQNKMGAQVGRLVDVEAEVIASATNNAVTMGTMAEMLLQAKKERK